MKLSSAQLPRIRTYADALAHFNGADPYHGGRFKGEKPLGNRRYTECRIHKYDGGDSPIALQYHGSDVVMVYPKDEFHISLCKWDTVGTRQFIWATTPFDIKHSRGVTYLGVQEEGETKWFAFDTAEATLKVKNNVVLNPVRASEHRLNRAALIDIQKRYRAFREYVSDMGSVLVGIPDTEVNEIALKLPKEPDPYHKNRTIQRLILPVMETRFYHGVTRPRETIKQFLIDVETAQRNNDLNAFYTLFVHLGVSALNYHSYLHTYAAGWEAKDVAIGPTMLKYFDEILKHVYLEEVFITKEVPLGKIASTTNSKYFK